MKLDIPLRSALPDRVQFKPYGLELDLSMMRIQVQVPDEEVVESKNGSTILTPRGAAILVSRMADAIDQIHAEYQQTKAIKPTYVGKPTDVPFDYQNDIDRSAKCK